MCGLVGVVGCNLTLMHLEAFKWMLYLDVIRGEDSTGIAFRKTITNKKGQSQVTLVKTEGHPSSLNRKFPELFDHKGVLYSRSNERFDFVMGHNRAATVGAVTANNAHPFHHGAITGCHNGTISGGLNSLPVSNTIVGNTDSEKLIYALSTGMSIQEVMNSVTGAAALAWWDSKKQTFNLYRNKERPLFISHNDAKTIYAYSSEEWILKLAFNKTRLAEFAKNVKEFKVDEHMEILFSDYVIKETKINKVEPKVYTPPKQVYNTSVTTFPARKEVKLQNHDTPNWWEKETVKPFRAESGWIDLSHLGKDEFEERAKYGCALCQDDLEYEDNLEGHVKWIEKDIPICSSCSKEFSAA